MKRRVLVLLLATVALAAGCASVPTKGPIRSGSQVGLVPDGSGIGVEAQKPRQNVDQLAVVNGFLEAMSDSRAFDVAREYMTPEAAARWQPESKISIYDQASAKTVVRRPDGRIGLKAPLIATIDRRGSWTPAPRKAVVDFVFGLVRMSGQWRVASAPDGVFLGSNQLDPKLEQRSLYFFTPARDMLVPDPVYLPLNLSPGQTATLLIQELLKGPTSRLGNGVVSAAPPGTQVNVSVPVNLGVATVALSKAAAALGDQDRRLLAAQIAWTLRPPISTRVRITVDGAPLLPDDPDELPFSNFSQYDPTVPSGQLKELYAIRNHKIQHIPGLDGSQAIADVPLNGSLLYGYPAESFAVALRGDVAAIVTKKDDSSVVAYAPLDSADKVDKLETIPADGKVLRPSFDSQGNLWILDKADSGKPRLRVRGQGGKPANVLADFQGATPLVLRMAPDGVRALMVMKKGATTWVQTGTVSTNDGKQLVLSRFKSLELPLEGITDASWYKANEVLVAGRSAAGTNRQPWEVNTDGSQPRLVPGASSFEALTVAASPNLDTLPVVQDTSGRLHWQSKDLSWVTMEDGPRSEPVYPG